MATLSFEDRIKALVKERLNPQTEDIIARKATSDANYFGDESEDFDKFAGVADPATRRRLVNNQNKIDMATSNTLEGVLGNRETGIQDIVGAFAKARAEETAAAESEWQHSIAERQLAQSGAQGSGAMTEYQKAQLELERAKMNMGDGPTALQQDYNTISGISGKDAADRWLQANQAIPAAPEPEVAPGPSLTDRLKGFGRSYMEWYKKMNS